MLVWLPIKLLTLEQVRGVGAACVGGGRADYTLPAQLSAAGRVGLRLGHGTETRRKITQAKQYKGCEIEMNGCTSHGAGGRVVRSCGMSHGMPKYSETSRDEKDAKKTREVASRLGLH